MLLAPADVTAQDQPAEDGSQAEENSGARSDAPGEAAETEQGEAESTEEDDVSAEELRLLQEALAADAEDAKEAQQAPVALGSTASAQQQRVGLPTANPDISLILDTAASYFRGEPAQVGAHDPNKTGFTLQQLEMHIEHAVDPFFRLDANIVFSQFGVEVEEAFATTMALDHGLQVRAGQFLTRFGRLNQSHPHSWDFLDQPLVNGKFFGGEGSRGLGAEASVLLPTPWYAEAVVSANEAVGACCARSFYGAEDLGTENPGDLLYTTALKQFFAFNDDLGLNLGVSAQFGPNAAGNGTRSEIYGGDLYLRYRPVDSPTRSALSWTAEFMHRRRQVPYGVLVDSGMYTQLLWNMNLNWDTGVRYEWVQGLSDDPLNPEWTKVRQRAVQQLTYRPSHFSRLRVQAGADIREDQVVWIGMVGLEVLVGAHGAHSY